jgi:hypothetical protein
LAILDIARNRADWRAPELYLSAGGVKRKNWRATADEDGHYSFAVTL